MAPPAAIGLASLPLLASLRADHSSAVLLPPARSQLKSLVALAVSEAQVDLALVTADLEEGQVADLLAVDTGALALSETRGRGLLVRGQVGGVAALAQLLTGLAGPLVPSAPTLHGQPGLDALLPLPLLLSTQHPSPSAPHTRPILQPVSVTRLLRPQALLLLPLAHPALTARSLQEVPLLQLSSVL